MYGYEPCLWGGYWQSSSLEGKTWWTGAHGENPLYFSLGNITYQRIFLLSLRGHGKHFGGKDVFLHYDTVNVQNKVGFIGSISTQPLAKTRLVARLEIVLINGGAAVKCQENGQGKT